MSILDLEPEIISGKITQVTFRPLSWKVADASGVTYTCLPDKPGRYLPVREGDFMTAIMLPRGKDERILLPDRLPAIEVQASEKSLINIIKKHLYPGYSEAQQQYQLLGRTPDEVAAVLDEAAQFCHDSGKAKLSLLPVAGQSSDLEVSADKLLHWWFKNVIVRQLDLLGISKKLHYSNYWLNELELLRKIKHNPFSVPCLPRELASAIYTAYDIWYPHVTPKMQELGAIMYSCYLKYKDGWAAVSKDHLIQTFPNIAEHLKALIEEEKMEYQHDCLYFDRTYQVESFLVAKIKELMAKPDGPEVTISMKPNSKELSLEQQEAIKLALTKPLSIITGGAGTGKSTTMAHLLHNLCALGVEYAVASFTGKAVSRIKEVMGVISEDLANSVDTYRYRPMTLHRLIREGLGMGVHKVAITCLVIDEASMVASDLMYQCLSLYTTIEKIILVGDVNQLQPIEWGCMFSQLVYSNKVPLAQLKTNFRTYLENGEQDGIIKNANALLATRPRSEYKWVTGSNFSLYAGGVQETANIVRTCFQAGITTQQLVVLSPYNESVDELNQALDPIFTEGKPSIADARGKRWAVGARVIMTKNKRDEGIYNGDLGDVVEVMDTSFVFIFGKRELVLSKSESSELLVTQDGWFLLKQDWNGVKAGEKTKNFKVGPKTVMVQFKEGRPKKFLIKEEDKQAKELEEFMDKDCSDLNTSMLDHAYCLTVNKSQGSEWDFVLFSLPKIGRGNFLNRYLVYTALTRAKRCVWIVSNNHLTLSIMVTNRPNYRVDNLALRLNDLPDIEKGENEGSNADHRQMEICDDDMFWDDDDFSF